MRKQTQSVAQLVSSGNCSVVLHANVVKLPLIKVHCVRRWWQPAVESGSNSSDLCCAVSFLFFGGCLVLMVSLTPAWLLNIYFVSTQCFTYEFCYVIVIAVNQVVTVVVVRAALLPFLSISVWVKDSDWSIDRSQHWQRRGVKRAWRRVANVANSWLLFCGKHDVCAMCVCSRDAHAVAGAAADWPV